MTDIALSFQDAVTERNYSTSSQLIDQALRGGTILELVLGLEAIEEVGSPTTLELRDHIFYYLGMWDIYFAVQIPSTEIMKLVHRSDIRDRAQTFMVDFNRDILERKDNRFDQFCVNIQTISKGQYAVLLPSILEQRTEELLYCKIQFQEGPPPLYCTADLLETYYGRKIVTATHGNRSFDIVIDEDQYATIRESLASTGLDTESMLVRIDSDQWEEYVKKRRRPRIHQMLRDDKKSRYGGSTELAVLHRVKSARSNIYSRSFNQQHTALNAIIAARTQLCNDVLMDVASDPSHQMRKRALKQLGESGELITLDFLDDMMKNDGNMSIRKEAARAYSALASRKAGMGLGYPLPATKPPVVDISKINTILNTLIAKGMPTAMIDETLSSVALQGGSESAEILLRLFALPQESVRQAIVKATRLLEKQSAALIIRAALNDESLKIVSLAEHEIDSRWPDEVWD